MGAVLEMRNALAALTVASLVLVGACSNQTDHGTLLKTVTAGAKGKLKLRRGAKTATPATPDVAAMVSESLARTTKPLALVVIENRNSIAVLTQIGANQGYRTWASADRRSITMTYGVVTATRGLGFDLMSADVSGSLPTVRARKSGATSRTLRFLNGENQIVATTYTCRAKAGGALTIALGEVNSPARTVIETCQSGAESYENTYQVSPSGVVLQSRQWLGPTNGYLVTQALRLE